MTTKNRISPRIAVIASALSSELGRVTVWDNEPATAKVARQLASVGQLRALRTTIIRNSKGGITHGVVYTLEDTHDQVTFRERHALHLHLQVAYRMLAGAQQRNQQVAETRHRRTIARLHAEQDAINFANAAA